MSEFLLYLLLIIVVFYSLDFILPVFYEVHLVDGNVHFKTFGLTIGVLDAKIVVSVERNFIFETIFLNPFSTLGFVNRPCKILMVLVIKTDSGLFRNIVCTPKNYDLFLEAFKI